MANRVKANTDVREQAKKAGIYLWQIAAAIGVSEPTFNRWLRTEMSADKKACVKSTIRRLEAEQKRGATT